MKIFRVETENGQGPFLGVNRVCTDASELYSLNYHPAPWRDDLDHLIDSGRPYKCGCDSIEMLKGWFNAVTVAQITGRLVDDDDRERLIWSMEKDRLHFKAKGFRVAVYELSDDECHYGMNLTQLAFFAPNAVLKEVLPIDVLFS